MPNKEKAPTYEEFKTETIKRLEPMIAETRKHYENSLTAEEYVNSEEGTFTVRAAYYNNKAEFDRGEFSRSIFLGDAVSSTAYCLHMLYEPYLNE